MKFKSLKKKGRITRYKKEHREIYEALVNRDFKRAELLTKKHLIDIREDIFDDYTPESAAYWLNRNASPQELHNNIRIAVDNWRLQRQVDAKQGDVQWR